MNLSSFAGYVVSLLAFAVVANQGVKAQNPRVSTVAATPSPADPHDPVTGGVQVPATPAAHAATLYLLERARQNSLTHNAGMQPYRFTMSFTAGGNVANTGSGELTEAWLNGRTWRWTASIGNVSVVRIASNGRLSENAHVEAIPTRAHMLRNEIFWALDQYAAKAQLRTASVQWNGKPATCILASGIPGSAAQSQTRLWQEEEYCVDNDSGLLVVHSIAPGTFATFSYAANQQFHGRTMPDRITIYVGGSLVADGSFSIGDLAPGDDSAITQGTGMSSDTPIVGVQMPSRIPIRVANPAIAPGTTQSVMVHADVDGEGKIVAEELSETGNPALTQAAMDTVRNMSFGPTRTQRQMYLNVTFGQ